MADTTQQNKNMKNSMHILHLCQRVENATYNI